MSKLTFLSFISFSNENNFSVEKIFVKIPLSKFCISKRNIDKIKNGKQLRINICNTNDKWLVFEVFYIFYMSIRNWNSLIFFKMGYEDE